MEEKNLSCQTSSKTSFKLKFSINAESWFPVKEEKIIS